MRLGVVSDTHGRTGPATEAVRILRACEVAEVIHCGDIGSAEIMRIFSEWPAHFVHGNNDDDAVMATYAQETGVQYYGPFGSLERAGRKIAFLHGDDSRRLRDELASGTWDLVCSGHTHRRRLQYIGKTLDLNPGALHRASTFEIAIVDLMTMEVDSHVVTVPP